MTSQTMINNLRGHAILQQASERTRRADYYEFWAIFFNIGEDRVIVPHTLRVTRSDAIAAFLYSEKTANRDTAWRRAKKLGFRAEKIRVIPEAEIA